MEKKFTEEFDFIDIDTLLAKAEEENKRKEEERLKGVRERAGKYSIETDIEHFSQDQLEDYRKYLSDERIEERLNAEVIEDNTPMNPRSYVQNTKRYFEIEKKITEVDRALKPTYDYRKALLDRKREERKVQRARKIDHIISHAKNSGFIPIEMTEERFREEISNYNIDGVYSAVLKAEEEESEGDSEETQSNQREKVGDRNEVNIDELMAGEGLTDEEIMKLIKESRSKSSRREKFSDANTVKVKNYLSESHEVKEAILLAKALLIIAKTNVGKTKGTIKALRSENKPFIFLVPNKSNKDQMHKEYGIQRTVWHSKGDKRNVSMHDLLKEGCREIVCCYETLRNYIEESGTRNLNEMGFYLIVYEIHKIITDMHYRENLSVINNDIKHKIFLTATPHLLNEDTFDNVLKVELSEREVLKPVVNIVNVSEGKNWTDWKYKKAIDSIRADHKGKKILHICTYREKQEEYLGLEDGGIINRENRDEKDEYNAIIEHGMLTKEYMISTNLFSAGVNILNEEDCILILDLEGKNISVTEIIQIIGRFRRATSLTVYFICRGNRRSEISFESYKGSVMNKIDLLNSKTISYNNLEIMHPMLSKAIELAHNNLYYTSDELIQMVIKNETLARQKTLDEVAFYCHENGIKVNERTIVDGEELEDYVKVKRSNSKKHLQELFLDMEGKEYIVTKGAIEYFNWRVILNEAREEKKKEIGKQMQRALEQGYRDFYYLLKEKRSLGKGIENAITKLASKMDDSKESIEEVLFNYFKLNNKYTGNSELMELKEEAQKFFLGLEDTNRYSKTKKWLYTNVKSMDKATDKLLDKKSLIAKVREILKALGLKGTIRKGTGKLIFELV